MKAVQILLLSFVCFLNIGWMWHVNPPEDEYLQKGKSAWEAGNLVEAMRYYQLSLDLNPKNPEVMNLLGVTYEEAGLSQKAEEKYLSAIKTDDSFLSSYFNLGILYWNRQEIDKSIYYFKKRIQLGTPKDPWTSKAQKALNHILNKIDMSRYSKINNDLDQWESNASFSSLRDIKVVERALDREDLMERSMSSSKQIQKTAKEDQDSSDNSKDELIRLKPWFQKTVFENMKEKMGIF